MIAEFVLLGIVSSVCSQSLHHAMSPEDLQKIFSVKSSAEVPDYDVVPISISKPRSRRYTDLYLHTTVFGQNLRLWLTPSDGILAGQNLPIYEFRTNPNNINQPYIKRYNTASLLPRVYENEQHASTLVVNYQPNGQPSTTGYIGDSYIQPVPSHLMEHAKRHRRSLNISLDQESNDQIYHVVRKIPKYNVKIHSGSLNLLSIMRNETSRSKRSYDQINQEAYPRIIYPEILLIVPLSLSQRIGQGEANILAYFLSFWNGVDMRYRSLESPKVRLNIAAIVFAEDHQVLPYMKIKDNLMYDSPGLLEWKGYWLYALQKYFPQNYDLAVTMFPFTMCDERKCQTAGLAYPGGACSVVRKVAFVTDHGAYDGIQSTAHELGHLFGMVHDGDNNNCADGDGYIMTRWDKYTSHSFDWSPCSLQQMDTYLKSGGGECLRNHPNQGVEIPRYLPGKRMSANQQCKQLVNGEATYIGDSICTQLKCSSQYNFALPEAAEGTFCGNGKLCLHGYCVSEEYVV